MLSKTFPILFDFMCTFALASMRMMIYNLWFSTLSCSNQETLGYVDINLSDVVSNKRINEKYHLIDSRNGRIQIELQWRTP